MSAEIVSLNTRKPEPTVLHPVAVTVLRELSESMATVREEIAETTSVAEAFALYQWVSALASGMASLADQAGARCEELMRRP